MLALICYLYGISGLLTIHNLTLHAPSGMLIRKLVTLEVILLSARASKEFGVAFVEQSGFFLGSIVL